MYLRYYIKQLRKIINYRSEFIDETFPKHAKNVILKCRYFDILGRYIIFLTAKCLLLDSTWRKNLMLAVMQYPLSSPSI